MASVISNITICFREELTEFFMSLAQGFEDFRKHDRTPNGKRISFGVNLDRFEV